MRVTLAGDNSGLGGALNYLNPLTDRLNKAIEEGSVQLMLNSTVTELVVKDGKCTGVKVGEVEYSAPTTPLPSCRMWTVMGMPESCRGLSASISVSVE